MDLLYVMIRKNNHNICDIRGYLEKFSTLGVLRSGQKFFFKRSSECFFST